MKQNLINPYGTKPIIGIETGQLILPTHQEFPTYQINQNIPYGFKENYIFMHCYPSKEDAKEDINKRINNLLTNLPNNSYIIISNQGYAQSNNELQVINSQVNFSTFNQNYYRDKQTIIKSIWKKTTNSFENNFLEKQIN